MDIKNIIVIRKFKNTDDYIILFPYDLQDYPKHYCSSIEWGYGFNPLSKDYSFSSWGSADYNHIFDITKPVKPFTAATIARLMYEKYGLDNLVLRWKLNHELLRKARENFAKENI